MIQRDIVHKCPETHLGIFRITVDEFHDLSELRQRRFGHVVIAEQDVQPHVAGRVDAALRAGYDRSKFDMPTGKAKRHCHEYSPFRHPPEVNAFHPLHSSTGLPFTAVSENLRLLCQDRGQVDLAFPFGISWGALPFVLVLQNTHAEVALPLSTDPCPLALDALPHKTAFLVAGDGALIEG